MRKLFWCGGVAVVVCAVSVYGAARWAENNPHAPMAGCAKVTWRVLTDWNPIVQVGRAMAAKTVAFFQGPKPPPAAPIASATVACPAEPGETCPPPIVEVIDLSTAHLIRLPEHGDNHRPDFMPSPDFALERELAYMQQQNPQPVPVEVVLPGAIEEAEQPVPAVMPPADKDDHPAAKPASVEQLLDLFHDDDEAVWMNAEELPMPRIEDADEEDAEELPTPAEEATHEAIPMPSEDEYEIWLEPPAAQLFGQTMPGAEMIRLAAEAQGVRIIINAEEEFLQTNVDSFGLYGGRRPEEMAQEPELLPMPGENAPGSPCPIPQVFGLPCGSDIDLEPMTETRAADDFELFLEGILVSPRGENVEHLPMPAESCDPFECERFQDFPFGEQVEPEQLPMPCEQDEATEESEMIHPGTPPDCREDPNIEHRYPGCQTTPGCTRGQGCPTGASLGKPHPETMECRPSDMPSGERKPME